MIKLFLLKSGFTDANADNEGKHYFCPNCAMIEGVIKYYPQLEKLIEIHHVDFKRPRPSIIELIGEENQSCPVLIIEGKENDDTDTRYFKSFGVNLFVDSTELITRYLSEKFGTDLPHH